MTTVEMICVDWDHVYKNWRAGESRAAFLNHHFPVEKKRHLRSDRPELACPLASGAEIKTLFVASSTSAARRHDNEARW